MTLDNYFRECLTINQSIPITQTIKMFNFNGIFYFNSCELLRLFD
jgi:hypothetical protein